jgi:hypothetical protein
MWKDDPMKKSSTGLLAFITVLSLTPMVAVTPAHALPEVGKKWKLKCTDGVVVYGTTMRDAYAQCAAHGGPTFKGGIINGAVSAQPIEIKGVRAKDVVTPNQPGDCPPYSGPANQNPC